MCNETMLDLMKTLWPITRSITGDGVRQTLAILQRQLPDLTVTEVPSGTQCFDWTIPPEWNIYEAYVIDPTGEKIIDYSKNNLHVMSYSQPINATMEIEKLDQHLHSLIDLPEAIPYITSYYGNNWGFCLPHSLRTKLKKGKYHVYINSELKQGSLTYGELLLPGKMKDEILLSTYICHPSLANDNLSGPVVLSKLAQYISQMPERKYTYRLVYLPETIGSIAYISKNLENLKKNVIAGYVLTCLGDDRTYSFLSSRAENTPADRVAKHILEHIDNNYQSYSFLERGSDERQYCSPGIDLPIASVMRSKYGEYPEYHTSLDNFDLVTESGLLGGFNAIKECLDVFEFNRTLKAINPCEPQLGKRGLYPETSTLETARLMQNKINVLAYCDGEYSLLDIAEKIKIPFREVSEHAKIFEQHKLVKLIDNASLF